MRPEDNKAGTESTLEKLCGVVSLMPIKFVDKLMAAWKAIIEAD
jgi:hypothetical protein